MERERARPPWPLVTACLVIVLEAAALGGMAGTFVVDVVRGSVTAVGATLVMTVLFLGLAAVLVLAARALARGQRWGRGPAVTWQLLQGASGVAGAATSPPLLTVALVGTAAVVLVGVLWPASRQHLTRLDVPPGVA